MIETYNIDRIDNDDVYDNGDVEVDAEDDMVMLNEDVYGENCFPQNVKDQDLSTRSFDSDIPIPISDDIGLDDQCVSNEIPTTNSGEVAYCIDETTEYGGSQVKLIISGHLLLNQCGSLLTRQKMR